MISVSAGHIILTPTQPVVERDKDIERQRERQRDKEKQRDRETERETA